MTRMWLIKTHLKETYSKVRISKYLSDVFPLHNGLKEGNCKYFYTLLQYMLLARSNNMKKDWN